MTKADTVVAYTYRADIYCPTCIIPEVGTDIGILIESQDTEGYLDDVAEIIEIGRHDEYSFDSSDFPKVVFASQMEEDEFCGGPCGEVI